MSKVVSLAALAITVSLLLGCRGGEAAPTAAESARLNEADAMLNGFDEEGPAPEGTSPSEGSD